MSRCFRARPIARFTVAAVLLMSVACYGYYPIAASEPRPGTELRVELTDSGAVALRTYLGDSVVAAVGRYRDRTPDGLQMNVAWTESAIGVQREWAGEPVTIPTMLIASTRERRLSPVRTALFSTALIAAAVAVREAFLAAGSGASGRGTPGGPK